MRGGKGKPTVLWGFFKNLKDQEQNCQKFKIDGVHFSLYYTLHLYKLSCSILGLIICQWYFTTNFNSDGQNLEWIFPQEKKNGYVVS